MALQEVAVWYVLQISILDLLWLILVTALNSSNPINCNALFSTFFNSQVSVVDELGIPVKFVGVGEGVEDLQPFDAEAFVNAIFPWKIYRQCLTSLLISMQYSYRNHHDLFLENPRILVFLLTNMPFLKQEIHLNRSW